MEKKMKKIQYILFTLLLSISLIACGSKLTPENFAKIQSNQTEAQVIKTLGKPTFIESTSFLGVTGTTYTYKKGDKQVTIVFVNGKVFGKDGKL